MKLTILFMMLYISKASITAQYVHTTLGCLLTKRNRAQLGGETANRVDWFVDQSADWVVLLGYCPYFVFLFKICLNVKYYFLTNAERQFRQCLT